MRPPPPEGRQIETADGDTVVVTGDDRVTILRKRAAEVRVVFDEERRTILVDRRLGHAFGCEARRRREPHLAFQ